MIIISLRAAQGAGFGAKLWSVLNSFMLRDFERRNNKMLLLELTPRWCKWCVSLQITPGQLLHCKYDEVENY